MRVFGVELTKAGVVDELRETVTQLQRDLEDVGWTSVAQGSPSSTKYLPMPLGQIATLCRQFWIRSPLAGQWVNLTTAFVFGNGVSLPKAKDVRVQAIIEEFWNDPDNREVLTSPQAQWALSAKRHTEGNLFFVLHEDEATGMLKVRLKDLLEVADVICDPQDRSRRQFYKCSRQTRRYDFKSDVYGFTERKWLYYPDMELAAPELAYDGPAEKLVTQRILHFRYNCDPNDVFGIPELLRGLDWIRTHKDMAGDMATLIKNLAQWSWKKKVKGTPAQVQAAAARHQATVGRTNPMPTVGGIWVGNDLIDLDPVNTPTGGAQIHDKGLRNMVLMVAAASGIFEHYYGNPETGNLATADAMELPMVKRFRMQQQDWTAVYDRLIQRRIDLAILAGELPGEVEFVPKENRWKIVTDVDRTVDLDFPAILDDNLATLSAALSTAVDKRLIDQEEAARQFMLARGINDVDAHLQQLKVETAQREAKAQVKFEQELAARGTPKVVETVTVPTRQAAVQIADKMATVEHKLGAYKKALSRAYRVFAERVQRQLSVIGPAGAKRGHVTGLAEAVQLLGEDLGHAATTWFPQAVELGRTYVRAHLSAAMKESLREATTEVVLSRSLSWNRRFVQDSLLPDLVAAIGGLSASEHGTEGAVKAALAETLQGFEQRVGMYASAFWAVEEDAVKSFGTPHNLRVNFVGADDEGTCDSCDQAMQGNPWLIAEAPRPGFDTVCKTNCRHALQIVSDTPAGAVV